MTQDLTRWNRAGLSRFRYVDANAATHLEALRLELASRFADWKRIQAETPADETIAEWTERLLKQYRDDRRDWAWETTRSFARALHILTEHVDAFANEGYLRTATQWKSVRRLATMVGYTPSPGSSATTPVVFMAKSDVTLDTLRRGFAIKHVPAGAPPVIFETLEDIDISFALNALRLKDWNKNSTALSSAQVFAPNPANALAWPVPAGSTIGAGELAVLESVTKPPAAAVAPVAAIVATSDGAVVTIRGFGATPAVPTGLTVDSARLHVGPTQSLVPRLNGPGVVRVSSPHSLVAGDVVAWKDGTSVLFAAVVQADSGAVRLRPASDVKALPKKDTALFRAGFTPLAQFEANSSEWRLPTAMALSGDFRVVMAGPDGALKQGLAEADLSITKPKAADGTHEAGYRKLGATDLQGARQIWYADPGKDKPVATVREYLPAKTLEFDGKPPALASGDLALLQTDSNGTVGYAAHRIAQIDKDAGIYRIVFAAGIGTTAITAVHGVFGAVLRPAGHESNPAAIAGQEIELAAGDEWPGLLRRGRQLVFASASDAFPAFAARIETLGPDAWKLRLDRALSGTIPRGDVMIHANVADAGHGETKPTKKLGSGDASVNNQKFPIDFDDVSHVRDVAMPGGVRADVRIEIEQEIYSQVATLRDSEPSDPHYVVRITEAGTLELEFGDGRHGRRLPSGSNNVLASIRRGSGLGGNLATGALTDLVKKHPALESFVQPIAAAGGDDRESIEQIRLNAPGRLTAMDRAISVADYQRLAQRFQGVWHAAAFEEPNYRRSREKVRLVIVPSGGGALGNLATEIRDFLVANGLPSIDIAIQPFEALPAQIEVRARVDSSRFDPTEVETRVRAAVLAAFHLQRRRPGQPLYRSEVTRVVENTLGVSNSDVVLFASARPGREPDWDYVARGDDGGIWAAYPKSHQVIYAANPVLITVVTAEASI
ncbi:MAG: hypothetical protein JWN71_228 [Xanthobacteraceae bacterium]|nr:hypothetical protein [Xanthobacteraceae bacterium]